MPEFDRVGVSPGALVCTTARFAETPDGAFWFQNAAHDYRYWTRYLSAYDDILLMARAFPVEAPPDGWSEATGPGVSAFPVPDFHTPVDLARRVGTVRERVRRGLAQPRALHLRVPCPLGSFAWKYIRPGRPYAVEVVGDPYDSFSPGAFKNPLRRVYRWWFSRGLRKQCAAAPAVTYVTREALQRRYPPGSRALAADFSDVILPPEAYRPEPRPIDGIRHDPPRLIFVGTLQQLYKGPDVLIRALAGDPLRQVRPSLVVAGDGQYASAIEAGARRLGVRESVTFVGHVASADELRRHLDEADLFVLPSLQEGLPRALIEAMARALPCVGSDIGGIPELLAPEDLVVPGDSHGLSAKIAELLSDPQRLAAQSQRNLGIARDYTEDLMARRRDEFYGAVRDECGSWLASATQADAAVARPMPRKAGI